MSRWKAVQLQHQFKQWKKLEQIRLMFAQCNKACNTLALNNDNYILILKYDNLTFNCRGKILYGIKMQILQSYRSRKFGTWLAGPNIVAELILNDVLLKIVIPQWCFTSPLIQVLGHLDQKDNPKLPLDFCIAINEKIEKMKFIMCWQWVLYSS